MISEKHIYNDFKLPIEYVERSTIKENIISDLELVETVNENETPMYEHLLKPKTNLGKMCINRVKKYYTSDIDYLRDTQKLLKKLKNIDYNKNNVDNMHRAWSKIKTNENFLEHYQYIEFTRFKWLNTISSFLFLLSIYNISSPVINLLTPFAIMVIPFIIIKLMRLPITAENYIRILKSELAKHPIGKIFTSFGKVSMNKKFYMIVGAGLYVYNLYQNILSCIRFYRNLNFIATQFGIIKTYLDNTIKNIDVLSMYVKDLPNYNSFYHDIQKNKEFMINLNKQIRNVPTCKTNFASFMKIGDTMKCFYTLYDSNYLETMINYSLGLNGYLEVLLGLKENILENNINKVKLVKDSSSTIIEIKDIYNPSLENPIKNNISFKKNKIITGPNAAGKTTILKSTILNILFSQQFGYGYFKSATLTPIDYLHCYINIPDSCSRDSLFQSEAKRCKDILDIITKNPDSKHFCVFDELFSGTNPYEAICTAKAYLEFISKNKNVKFLLTTHFIRLCKICDKKNIENYNMLIDVVDEKLNYTYKIDKGISNVKGGIHVLENLGYSNEIIQDAKKTIKEF